VDIVPANNSGQFLPEVNVTVPVGLDPFGVAYDNATGDVFVANTGSNNVSVLFGNLSAPIANIPVGVDPMGVAYDSWNGEIYVADNGSANLTVINGTSLLVMANISVGNGPLGVAANPNDGAVFVADYGAAEVSKISGTTNHVVATTAVGKDPYGVAVDNATGRVFVTNPGSSNISVLSGSTADVVATIPVWFGLQMQGVDYDAVDGLVWIGAGVNFMVVVDPNNASVQGYIQVDPSGVTYDPTSGNVCVTNTDNRTLECIEFSYLGGGTPGTPTTIWETGLPAGYNWSVIVADGTWYPNVPVVVAKGNTSEIEVNSIYPLSIAPWLLSVPSAGSYFAGPLLENGTYDFNVTFALRPGFYPVTFYETGLPIPWTNVTGWSATVGSSSASSNATTLTIAEANGTFPFTIPTYDGYLYLYSNYQHVIAYPNPCGGNVTVAGAGVDLTTDFATGSSTCDSVQFNENGLPNGDTWNVTLNSVTQSAVTPVSQIEFSETPGIYNFSVQAPSGFRVSPQNGAVTLDGSTVVISLSFVTLHPTYLVTFAESGLPTGTGWSVTLAGTPVNTTLTTIRFAESNGTYPYSIGQPSAYYANVSSGIVTVAGSAIVVSIGFQTLAAGYYAVTFAESGLTSGTIWSVTLDSDQSSSGGTTIGFIVGNGTYSYDVGTVAGYVPTPRNGSVVVAGGPLTVNVTYASTAAPRYTVSVVESGLSNGTTWSAKVAGLEESSATQTIKFIEPNGTYTLVVPNVSGYSIDYVASVEVNGGPVSVPVAFTNTTVYPLTVTESGVPTGSVWQVTATNIATGTPTAGESGGSTIVLYLESATYTISATGPNGYRVTVSTSEVVVKGASPAPITVTFAASSGLTTPLPFVSYWALGTLFVTGLIAVGGIWEYRHSRYSRQRALGQSWLKEFHDNAERNDQVSPPRP